MTQAELWASFLKIRTAGCAGSWSETMSVMKGLAADYPHKLLNLTEKGDVVGLRRVFGDRSIADIYSADPDMKITCDTLNEGLIAVADNGRLIH